MDNELSMGMRLTIELIVLSAVVGIILLFAGIGQQVQRSTVTSATDVAVSAYGSEITALGEYQDLIPAATVYLALEKNADWVQTVDGTINRTLSNGTIVSTQITSKESLKSFFDMKVKVTVDETNHKIIIAGG